MPKLWPPHWPTPSDVFVDTFVYGGLVVVAVVAARGALRTVLADLPGFAALLLVLGLIGLAVLGSRRIVRGRAWTRPVRILKDPVPEHWESIVREAVPLTERLDPVDFQRLLKFIQVFLKKKRIEGAGGLELTDEIRLSVAAQACLLVLWMEVGLYPGLKTVIVYPDAMVPRYAGEAAPKGKPRSALLGQSWSSGVVILSWDSVQHGAFDPRDGKNVVLHEFAHQLDQEDGAADGLPVGLPLSAVKPWAEVLERRLNSLRRKRDRGTRSVMRKYGATNEAEFFAVASETFFEKPLQLRRKMPELFALLVETYRVDPLVALASTRPSE